MNNTSIADINKLVYEANTDASSDNRHYKIAVEKLKEIMNEDIMNVLDVTECIAKSICGRKELIEDVVRFIYPQGTDYNKYMMDQLYELSMNMQEKYVGKLDKNIDAILARFTFGKE